MADVENECIYEDLDCNQSPSNPKPSKCSPYGLPHEQYDVPRSSARKNSLLPKPDALPTTHRHMSKGEPLKGSLSRFSNNRGGIFSKQRSTSGYYIYILYIYTYVHIYMYIYMYIYMSQYTLGRTLDNAVYRMRKG